VHSYNIINDLISYRSGMSMMNNAGFKGVVLLIDGERKIGFQNVENDSRTKEE
jgi:hypothetical protein